MNIEINDDYFRQKLVENDFWQIDITYPNALVLDFGNKIEYTLGKFGKHYKGEWIVYSEFCFWRIRQNNNILCSSYLYSGENEEIIKGIKMKKLIDFKHTENDDFIFIFDNSFEIEILSTIESEAVICIKNLDDSYLYSKNKKWYKDNFNESNKFDELMSIYSKECHERWENIVPEISKIEHCKNCIYYIPIYGDAYFSDYGICSNKESNYDGKLVYCNSNCEYNLKNLPK
jgi:hypothetical protein